ncbi:MAG: choice-of-anchor D domain-containing protein, partial [Bacteroidetes bacterium]|nr:choice-of-anchor D domain-containing protein [Bacteroidota bacterium]
VANTGGGMNGVTGGSTPGYEASGGGTGHPFGTSGTGCGDGAGCNPPGGFGGGSGQQQTQAGGAGGYATAGGSSRNGNGGQIHGNEFIIPFAGGSGGASGNPQLAFSCSGDGGGGGGALRIFGRQLDGYLFSSIGAGGTNGASGDGGSGSGGAVLLESKLPSGVWKIRAEGGVGTGPRGGGGRIRMDGPIGWYSGGLPAEESMAYGPSTDTTMFVRRSFTITGTGDGAEIRLFLKSDRMPWTDLGTVVGYTTNWSFDIDLPALDNVYYLVALQEISNPGSDDFSARPLYVMSQSAANVLISRTVPEILADASRQLSGIRCEDVSFDTTTVSNVGDGVLIITDAGFVPGGNGYVLIEPTVFPLSIDPGDSVRIITRFTRQPGQRGEIVDTLFITSNSPAASPLSILYRIDVDVAEMTPSVSDIVFPDVIICESPSSDAFFDLTNTGTIPLTLPQPVIDNPAFSLVSPAPGLWPLTLQPGATLPIQMRVTHTMAGNLSGTMRIEADNDGCNALRVLPLSGASSDVSIFVSDIPLFPALLCSGEVADTMFLIRNDGDLPFVVTEITPSDPTFIVLSPAVPFPLAPGAQQLVRIRFAPDAPGVFNENVHIAIDRCALQVDRPVVGQRDSVGVRLSAVEFGLQRAEFLPVMQRTTVTNTGSVPVTIASATAIPPFRVVSGIPVNLPPGASVDLMVQFDDPGVDGEHAESLQLQLLPSCYETALAVHGIRGTASVDLVVDTLSAEPGQIIDVPIYLRNARNMPLFGATAISARLRYRNSLLVPVGADQGTIVGEERVLDLTIPLLVDANDVALRIPMMVTLGDAEATDLLLTDVVAIGGDLSTNVIQGRFTLLGICRDGGTRLFDGGSAVQLKQNRPNPFNPGTELEFVLIERGHTVLQVYDAMGRRVRTLVDEFLEPGSYVRSFDGRDLPSGVYITVLRTPTVLKQRRMLLMK